jgi:formylglycine-generating enzyme required for sulfatase activity
VSRGGGWGIDAEGCRSASRYYDSPDYRYYSIGFRLALSPE